MAQQVSFEESVRLFLSWGFQVEPGPRPGEVTLILEQEDSRTYLVYDEDVLPQVATVALRTRLENGAINLMGNNGPDRS